MITEGLIKLPMVLYKELEHFVLNWYFAHAYATISRRFRFDEDSLDSAHRLITAACKHYNVRPSESDIKIARDKFNFIKTFTLNENVYGEQLNMKVKLKLVLERQQTKNLGIYNDRTGFIILSAFNLHMTGPSLSTVSAVRHSLGKVEELLGYLRHELTHLIQYRALVRKHGSQLDGGTDLESDFDDSYALSQSEFDPLIKSAQGILAKLEVKYKYVKGYKKRELQDAFVHATNAPHWMSSDDQSGFFSALKRNDTAKWKKAVKLFMAGHKYY